METDDLQAEMLRLEILIKAEDEKMQRYEVSIVLI